MDSIQYRGRWREELEAISSEGKLIFEFTMGKEHVYFPDQTAWLAQAPAWARDKWAAYLESSRLWCEHNRIPMPVVAGAHFYAEK